MRKFLALSLLVMSASAFAQDKGLLLGLSDKDGKSHTVWIGQQGVATFARRAGDGYWLWQKGGFMHIVPEDLSRFAGRATVTVTDVDGSVRVIRDEGDKPVADFHVMYVAPRGIGLMRLTDADTRRSQDTDTFRGLTLAGDDAGAYFRSMLPKSYRHYDWTDLDTVLDIDAVFDDETEDRFIEGAKSLAFNVSPSSWTLRRDRGAWSLYGLLYQAYRNRPGMLAQEYPVGPLDDKSLGAVIVKGPKWSRIVSEYPDAIDFIVSPDGKTTVIVTATDVFVHASSGSSLQKRLQRVRVPADRVVMTQWLEGDVVRKVGEAVTKIKG